MLKVLSTVSFSPQVQQTTQWEADTFDPSNRGNNFLTALHKLDHDREQVCACRVRAGSQASLRLRYGVLVELCC